MTWLSIEAENDIKKEITTTVSTFLESYTKPQPRLLGLMTAQQVKEELGIEYKTLQRWELAGLKRYQPPLEDTRKMFYKVSDILVFLGIEK